MEGIGPESIHPFEKFREKFLRTLGQIPECQQGRVEKVRMPVPASPAIAATFARS